MRTHMRLVVSSLALVAGATPARAYSIEHETLEAHIPFAFQLSDAKLPPGDYEIRQASGIDPELLEIRSKDSRHAAFFMAESSASRHGVTRPSLVFDRLGRDRFLRAVWVGDGNGDVVSVSAAELADAHRVAAASARHQKQAAAVKK